MYPSSGPEKVNLVFEMEFAVVPELGEEADRGRRSGKHWSE